jgi:hypothetical protein
MAAQGSVIELMDPASSLQQSHTHRGRIRAEIERKGTSEGKHAHD